MQYESKRKLMKMAKNLVKINNTTQKWPPCPVIFHQPVRPETKK